MRVLAPRHLECWDSGADRQRSAGPRERGDDPRAYAHFLEESDGEAANAIGEILRRSAPAPGISCSLVV
jgi:hypothetical protein